MHVQRLTGANCTTKTCNDAQRETAHHACHAGLNHNIRRSHGSLFDWADQTYRVAWSPVLQHAVIMAQRLQAFEKNVDKTRVQGSAERTAAARH
jgi:hypothetical protein